MVGVGPVTDFALGSKSFQLWLWFYSMDQQIGKTGNDCYMRGFQTIQMEKTIFWAWWSDVKRQQELSAVFDPDMAAVN